MDKKELMWIIVAAEGIFFAMAFVFYLLTKNFAAFYNWVTFFAWLIFAMYVVEAVAKLLRVPKRFAALVGVITAIVLLAALGLSIFYLIQSTIPPLVKGIENLVSSVPAWEQRFKEWSQRSEALAWLFNTITKETQSWAGQQTIGNIVQTVGKFLTSSGGSLAQIALAIVISGLFIPYKDRFLSFADKRIPKAELRELDQMMSQYALQRLVSGFSLSVVLFIGNSIILGNSAMALGIASLGFTLDFIPYVGPFFAFVINAVVVLVASPSWLRLLFSLIVFLLGQGIEQLVGATMASMQFSIPFIVAIFLVIFGGVIAGVPGLILGVPIGAYIINLWQKKVKT
ncbi:AI-2E family transporter [Coprothermobacter platensis]|uniref:AI-2E family transporter n=1 Tax=Coprothermobacter platensis TaxID=108819 RepID=UPI00036FE301|nr:AI-2E family transporter [Coprothermobacter platensis]